jgi:opacity protein-like surface antigen|tara:strand:- start:285 stop:929 length:645 start_codon:yes stop_codon:yes gene_type:complete
MKNLVKTILASLMIMSLTSAKAEIGFGVTGAVHMLDAKGSETLRSSGKVTNATRSETSAVPEIFLETIADNGAAFGISYIPVRELGNKSRSDTNAAGDTGTYSAKAEIENVIMVYGDIPLPVGYGVYGKLGIQHATLKTDESLNSGSAYENQDILGLTLGLGTKGDLAFLGDNTYYKVEGTYTDFQQYTAENAGNRIVADLDSVAVKLSIGYKF